jgi:hypothetical protein
MGHTKKFWIGISVIIALFLIFVPVIPLMHSLPNNAPNVSWPNFFGSIGYALFKFGILVNGVGNIEFSTP